MLNLKINLTICSGGQTGADRQALDWAISKSLPHGGWCPKGRIAEDGIIPAHYELRETSTADYRQRTEQNVLDSDGTVIFTIAPTLESGTLLTAQFALASGKPCLHIHSGIQKPAQQLARFIRVKNIVRLNVAGSRASREPAVGALVQGVLDAALQILSAQTT